jgi:hypothetical protein
MTLKEANRKLMDLGGAVGMLDAAGTEEPVSVGGGEGHGEGGSAGAAPTESTAAGGGDVLEMQAAHACPSEAKPAQVPVALAASGATRWLTTYESGVAKTAKAVAVSPCRTEERGGARTSLPAPATAPPRCAPSWFFLPEVL